MQHLSYLACTSHLLSVQAHQSCGLKNWLSNTYMSIKPVVIRSSKDEDGKGKEEREKGGKEREMKEDWKE